MNEVSLETTRRMGILMDNAQSQCVWMSLKIIGPSMAAQLNTSITLGETND